MRVDLDVHRAARGLDRIFAARLHRMGALSVARAKRLAPVDTGALRDAIGYEVDEAELRMRFGVLPGPIPRGPAARSSPLLYGPIVELRHQSFIRRTADELAQDYRSIAARGR